MKPNNFPLRPTLNGSEELYTQTNNVSQKFTLDSTKEFVNKAIDVTYSELYSKIINGELITGSWYRLTDYKSVNFLNGMITAQNNPTPTDPNFDPHEIYTGEAEVLIFQATSPYEISEISYSETFNGDIVQYEPYTNKVGIDFEIFNGQTLPDLSTVSGFDLQWDGTNVYFNMPTGYPALFGHYFYLYAEFDGGSYYQDGTFEPLTPNIATAQYPYTTDTYPKVMSRLKVENNGTKVILLDLTEADYLNYDADTLYVNSVFALGDAYGWVTRRIDTHRNIDTPFDFRGRKYRRFEVDLSSVNSSLGTGYYGIGDDYLGQGTTGNYKDFKCFPDEGEDIYNIKWTGLGGADNNYYRGKNDNNVFIKNTRDLNIIQREYFEENTFESVSSCDINAIAENNVVTGPFTNNFISGSFAQNKIAVAFFNNDILSAFTNNSILASFHTNLVAGDFTSNTVGQNFTYNTIEQRFISNTVGDNFRLNKVATIISSINFTAATHVYGDYNCTLFKRSNGTTQLNYIDGTNTVQYAAINS